MAAIHDSSVTSEKANISVANPAPAFTYFENGEPIANGFLYFGLPGRDGEVEENRKIVYAIQENGGALPIGQPVTLSAGGIPQYNGKAVMLATDGSYSLKVVSSIGKQEYFWHTVVAKSLLGYSGIIPEESKVYFAGNDVVFANIEATTASFYASTVTDGSAFKGEYLKKDTDYTVINETTIRILSSIPDNSVILGRALDPTGQTVNVTNSTQPFFIYDTKTEVISADLKVGSSVLVNGGDVLGDGKGGSYLVVSGGTGADDGYTYINLDNGNQLKLKSIYQLFSGYYESLGNSSIVSGELRIDPTEGNVFKETVTENITSIQVSNIPASGELKIQLELKQDPTTPRAITWSINGAAPVIAGGTLPTFTATVDAKDEYIIKTNDGGVSWTLYVIGQDIK